MKKYLVLISFNEDYEICKYIECDDSIEAIGKAHRWCKSKGIKYIEINLTEVIDGLAHVNVLT